MRAESELSSGVAEAEIAGCKKLIYSSVRDGPKSLGLLVKLYVAQRLNERGVFGIDAEKESLTFGMAFGRLVNERKIGESGGMYEIVH